MDSRRDRMRTDDRLSGLPDDLICKILSFVGLKDAIRTSVLSSRWRFMWTSIPHLSFSTEDFSTIHKFSDCVTHVLSRRSTQFQLSTFNLHIREEDGNDVAQRIISHLFSFNVQQVNITCLFGDNTSFSEKKVAFPLSLSGSQTLKHLTLSRPSSYNQIILTSAQEFASLTTLHLYFITLYDGFLSMFPNLENLTLHCCKVTESEVLRISHPRLSNLTLENGDFYTRIVDVVTPQLKNLTISNYFREYRISAPKLDSLLFRGLCPSMFSTDGLHSLEKATLSFHSLGSLSTSDASTVISLLKEFHNVKFLSLSMEIIQLLNSSVEVISHQPFPLANLRTLRILPKILCYLRHTHARVFMSTEVKNYLLSSSPKATLTEVLREECCDIAAGADPDSLANSLSLSALSSVDLSSSREEAGSSPLNSGYLSQLYLPYGKRLNLPLLHH